MLRIEADVFGIVKSPLQAWRVGKLVSENRDWLPDSNYSGAMHRYGRTSVHALWYVSRLAMVGISGPTHFFVLGRETSTSRPIRTVGIGTISQRREVEHPKLGIVEGTDVDYWLDEKFDSDPGMHKRAARALVNAAIDFEPRLDHKHNLTVYGTTVPGATHQPKGLQSCLNHEAGDPATLLLPEGQNQQNQSDTLGLLKGGQVLQLHTAVYEIGVGF